VGTEIRTSAFIANTDFGWLTRLQHRAEAPAEADFCQPSPHVFEAISPRPQIHACRCHRR